MASPGGRMRYILVTFCLYIICGVNAFATTPLATTAASPTQTSGLKSEDVIEKERKFSLALELGTESNLRDTSDTQYKATSSITITPSYKILPKATLSAIVGVEQKLYADTETAIINTTVSLSRDPIELKNGRSVNLAAFGLLPTNESDRNDATLQGGTGLAAGITQNFNLAKKAATLNYTLSALKNYHEYERSNILDSNISHRARHIITYNQEITKAISLKVLSHYQTGWTYQNVLKTSFLISEELILALNRSASIYIGHSNNATALQANGVDSNIQIYDDRTSTFSAGMTLTY
jgi:hypothetical protein